MPQAKASGSGPNEHSPRLLRALAKTGSERLERPAFGGVFFEQKARLLISRFSNYF
jgi:hypothetical protein